MDSNINGNKFYAFLVGKTNMQSFFKLFKSAHKQNFNISSIGRARFEALKKSHKIKILQVQ